VEQLFITWGALVVPTLVCLAASIHAPSEEEAIHSHTLVFTSLMREWDSEDFSSILYSISGEPIAEGGLGYPMGLADMCHFLIGVMRRHLHAMIDKYKFAEELFNQQSGHGNDVALRYAINFASIQNFPEECLLNFSQVSQLHHKLLTRPACGCSNDAF